MDDDWEIAHFDNLSRDGTADSDDDGANDRAEFLAGTEPTDGASIFRVLTLTALGGGSKRLIWTGNPARNYRIEYKDELDSGPWLSLAVAVSWNRATATAIDPVTNPNRFYRIVRLP